MQIEMKNLTIRVKDSGVILPTLANSTTPPLLTYSWFIGYCFRTVKNQKRTRMSTLPNCATVSFTSLSMSLSDATLAWTTSALEPLLSMSWATLSARSLEEGET
jgi:hypothetical protein